MKNLFLSLLLSFAPIVVFAQVHITAPYGNTGVGTTTPTEKLEVAGLAKTEGNTVEETGASASTLYERTDKAAMIIGAGAQAGFTFDNNYNFEIRSRARSFILNRKLSLGPILLSGRGSDGYIGFGTDSPTERIHVVGNIFATGTITPSDERLKDNVTDFTDGLSIIKLLKPIRYTYNGKAGLETDKVHIGVYAQDLQRVAPYLVESFVHEQKDEEGNLIAEEEYLKIHDSEIKFLMINAIKEQQEIIEEQESEIELMKKEMAAIKEILSKNVDKTEEQNVELSGEKDQAELEQNIPNPFTSETQIGYYLPENIQMAVMRIFDIRGQLIKEIPIEQTGKGSIRLSISDLAKGVYHYSLIGDGVIIDTKKMVLN